MKPVKRKWSTKPKKKDKEVKKTFFTYDDDSESDADGPRDVADSDVSDESSDSEEIVEGTLYHSQHYRYKQTTCTRQI